MKIKDTPAPKNFYHLVNPKFKEGTLAVTFFRKKWDGARFFMGFQQAFLDLAQKRFVGETTKVLFLILGSMDFDNLLRMPQVEMAHRLGIRKQNVSRAIRVLLAEQVLIERESLFEEQNLLYKSRRQLVLNKIYAWKGKLKNLTLSSKELQAETSLLDRLIRDLRKRRIRIYVDETLPRDGKLPDMILKDRDERKAVIVKFVDFPLRSKEALQMKKRNYQPGEKLILVEKNKMMHSYKEQFRRLTKPFNESESADLLKATTEAKRMTKSKQAPQDSVKQQ